MDRNSWDVLVNRPRLLLKEDIIRWLDEEISSYSLWAFLHTDFCSYSVMISFDTARDAMHFKMKFG